MNIQIARDDLFNCLSRVIGCADSKTMPILACVLIESDGGHLVMTCTDCERQLQAQIAFESEPFRLAVDAGKLHGWIKNLPDGAELNLEINETRIKLASGKSRFALARANAESFPAFPVDDLLGSIILPGETLRAMFKNTVFCAAPNSEVRYYLHGIALYLTDGHLLAVASDGHRLARHRIDHPGPDFDKEFILHAESVREAIRHLNSQPVELELHASAAVFKLNDLSFSTRLIEGRFPDPDKIIPRDDFGEITFDRLALLNCLYRIELGTDKSSCRFRFENGVCTIEADMTEIQSSEQIDYENVVDSPEVGMNVGYIISCLSAMACDRVNLSISDRQCFVLTESGRDFAEQGYLIMPMRL
jgi:DNA polymerase-3 subunit beta